MYSYAWRLIDSRPLGLPRVISFFALVFISIGFSLPRITEGWFNFVLLFYPVFMVAMLLLIKNLLPHLAQVKEMSLSLLENERDKEDLEAYWSNSGEGRRIQWCFAVASFLAITSLVFNANTLWSRYSDAMGVFYLGLFVGEITYLLLLIPDGVSQLQGYPLKLNPIDPANTVKFSNLADSTLVVGVSMGMWLFGLNVIFALTSYIYPHLTPGVIFVSIFAWGAIIAIAVYPHIVLGRIIQAKKLATIAILEEKLYQIYEDTINDRPSSIAVENTITLYKHLVDSQSLPISIGALVSIMLALLLNSLPIIVELLD